MNVVYVLNIYLKLDAHFSKRSSIVWAHYTITVERITSPVKDIIFVFTCKHLSTTHETAKRSRTKLSQGSSNLLATAKTCDTARGVTSEVKHAVVPKYVSIFQSIKTQLNMF